MTGPRHCKICNVEVGKGKSYCPECYIIRRRLQNRESRKRNPICRTEYYRKWREANKDKVEEYKRIDRENRPQRHCKKCNVKVGKRKYYCPECLSIRQKEQKKRYNDAQIEYRKKRIENNREAYNNYYVERRKKDVAFRLRCNISSAVSAALSGRSKSESAFKKLGYTMEQLKEHLEKHFDDKMNWDNYGRYPGWQIDHSNPQSNLPFDSLDHPNFLKCWNLDNLRPMWAKENLEKSNKLVEKEFYTMERFF